jgi:acetate kinase
MAEIRSASVFAPLHVPPALSVVSVMRERSRDLPQVVCFDTAFHRDLPDVARVFALPRKIRDLGVERYGFHGLSCESVLAQLDNPPARIVIAHLGNGASITAVRNGVSIDTSMGLTPTGGILMGTRCGDLDPSISIFLIRNGFADADRLEHIYDHESGLLGISGQTSDVRELEASRTASADADLALQMFCYQARKTIAAMAAALGGLDLLVFTGGIGEHSGFIRDQICAGVSFLPSHATAVLPAQEELQMARIAATLIGARRV